MEEQNKNPPPCNCGCGGLPGPPKPVSCSGKPFPFSKDELLIFEALRRVRKEVDRTKALLKTVPSESQDEKKALEMRLEQLRSEWDTLKLKSDEAARERMIALGHIDPKKDG
jgi:hypothetical protein